MNAAVRIALFAALAGVFAIGLHRLLLRFRKEVRFAQRFSIIAFSAVWLIIVAPTVGGLIDRFAGEFSIAVFALIACWPFFILAIMRIDFSSIEWRTSYGVEHRRERLGVPTTRAERIFSNVMFGCATALAFALTTYYFSHE